MFHLIYLHCSLPPQLLFLSERLSIEVIGFYGRKILRSIRQPISGYEGLNTQTYKLCLIEWMVEQQTHKPEIGELNPTKILAAENCFKSL